MAIDTETIVGQARWLPHRLVDGGRVLRFIEADRSAQRAATFLDDASLGDRCVRHDVPMAHLSAASVAAPATPVHYIFHSAFARSTLLARAMDIPGIAMGLKEPIILNDAADLHRQHRLAPDVLSLTVAMLSRPLAPGEAIIIKPSNIVTPLMMPLMQTNTNAKALLLYRDLQSYLRSVARKGMFGRVWARQSFMAIRHAAPFETRFSEADIFAQTDLQIAAAGWLIQQGLFAALARTMPDRVRLLDAAALVADRRSAFAAVAAWFGLPLDGRAIDRIVGGPSFSEDSKRIGERFGEDQRAESPVDDAEIAMVTQWAHAVAKHVGLQLDFGPRLIADA